MTRFAEDAKSLCAALNRFGLPRAVANSEKDCLLASNTSFQERTGFTHDELTTMSFSELVKLGPVNAGSSDSAQFCPCTVRCAHRAETILGTAVRRQDGYVYLMLDVVNPEDSAFEHGRWVGADQQRARCERMFRDQADPKLLAAATELEAVREQLEACQQDPSHLVRANDALEAAFEVLGACLRMDE